MLASPDPVTRAAAATLLGDSKASDAVAPLTARLAKGVEADDDVRDSVVHALRALGDPRAVPALVDAAARDAEPDLQVAMVVAAFEIAGAGADADLRRAGDVLLTVVADDGAPRAARRDAGDALCAHVIVDAACKDAPAATAWWHDHRDTATWQAASHKFITAGGS